MSTEIKSISHNRAGQCLHIETPLGIVNIRVGLSDRRGRRVDSIEVIASNGCGDPKVVRRGYANTRLVELKTVRS